jgi:hypothetical protein
MWKTNKYTQIQILMQVVVVALRAEKNFTTEQVGIVFLILDKKFHSMYFYG